MMDTAFEGQRIPAGFTLRIVEAVKHIKVHPMPRATALPWGLSAAVGIIITVMSFSFNLQMSMTSDITIPAGSPLPAETKVLKTGEIPVDILKASEISFVANKQGNGEGGKPQTQKALMLAPRGEGGKWTKKADMPTARMDLGVSVVDGKIYAIGGQKSWFVGTLATVEVYDPARDEWTKKTDMPSPRWKVRTSVVDGKIYAIGGWAGDGNGFAHSTVEEYDPATDTWTRKADMPTARCAFATSVVNGRIYAIGGWDKGKGDFSTVEEYDPATDTWTKKANIPNVRCDIASAVVDGKIYVFGGVSGDDNPLLTVEAYDPATDTWEKKADMQVGVFVSSAEAANGKVYLIGGWDGNDALAAVQEYDPATDAWTKMTDMLTPRVEMGTCVVNGKIYTIGGAGRDEGQGVTTVEEYTPEGWPFGVSPQGKLPTKWGEVKSE